MGDRAIDLYAAAERTGIVTSQLLALVALAFDPRTQMRQSPGSSEAPLSQEEDNMNRLSVRTFTRAYAIFAVAAACLLVPAVAEAQGSTCWECHLDPVDDNMHWDDGWFYEVSPPDGKHETWGTELVHGRARVHVQQQFAGSA